MEEEEGTDLRELWNHNLSPDLHSLLISKARTPRTGRSRLERISSVDFAVDADKLHVLAIGNGATRVFDGYSGKCLHTLSLLSCVYPYVSNRHLGKRMKGRKYTMGRKQAGGFFVDINTVLLYACGYSNNERTGLTVWNLETKKCLCCALISDLDRVYFDKKSGLSSVICVDNSGVAMVVDMSYPSKENDHFIRVLNTREPEVESVSIESVNVTKSSFDGIEIGSTSARADNIVAVALGARLQVIDIDKITAPLLTTVCFPFHEKPSICAVCIGKEGNRVVVGVGDSVGQVAVVDANTGEMLHNGSYLSEKDLEELLEREDWESVGPSVGNIMFTTAGLITTSRFGDVSLWSLTSTEFIRDPLLEGTKYSTDIPVKWSPRTRDTYGGFVAAVCTCGDHIAVLYSRGPLIVVDLTSKELKWELIGSNAVFSSSMTLDYLQDGSISVIVVGSSSGLCFVFDLRKNSIQIGCLVWAKGHNDGDLWWPCTVSNYYDTLREYDVTLLALNRTLRASCDNVYPYGQSPYAVRCMPHHPYLEEALETAENMWTKRVGDDARALLPETSLDMDDRTFISGSPVSSLMTRLGHSYLKNIPVSKSVQEFRDEADIPLDELFTSVLSVNYLSVFDTRCGFAEEMITLDKTRCAGAFAKVYDMCEEDGYDELANTDSSGVSMMTVTVEEADRIRSSFPRQLPVPLSYHRMQEGAYVILNDRNYLWFPLSHDFQGDTGHILDMSINKLLKEREESKSDITRWPSLQGMDDGLQGPISVEEIVLGGIPISPAILRRLSRTKFPGLRRLRLLGCEFFEAIGIGMTSGSTADFNLGSLETLDLRGLTVQSDEILFESLPHLGNLRHLNLSISFLDVSDNLLQCLSKFCPFLESLIAHVNSEGVTHGCSSCTDYGLATFTDICSSLSRLQLSIVPKVYGAFFKVFFKKCLNVRDVVLSAYDVYNGSPPLLLQNSFISEKDLLSEEISSDVFISSGCPVIPEQPLPNLREFRVNLSFLDDHFLEGLEKCANNLEVFCISSCGITAAALAKFLEKMQNLRRVCVPEELVGVHKECWMSLASLPLLQFLAIIPNPHAKKTDDKYVSIDDVDCACSEVVDTSSLCFPSLIEFYLWFHLPKRPECPVPLITDIEEVNISPLTKLLAQIPHLRWASVNMHRVLSSSFLGSLKSLFLQSSNFPELDALFLGDETSRLIIEVELETMFRECVGDRHVRLAVSQPFSKSFHSHPQLFG